MRVTILSAKRGLRWLRRSTVRRPLEHVRAPKRKRLSPEQRALIIKKLKANPNACVVAREVGNIVSDRTVQIIAKKAQIPLAMGGSTRFALRIVTRTGEDAKRLRALLRVEPALHSQE